MTYHVEVQTDGSVRVPEELVRSLGIKPGDTVSVNQSGARIIVNRSDEQEAALRRLRTALSGYSVDKFLAERGSDWRE